MGFSSAGSYRPAIKTARRGSREDALHFDLQKQPGIIFRRLANASHAMFHRLSGQDEITGPQLTVLVTLLQGGAMTQSEISKAVSMDKNTLTEMLRRMHARRLVSRTPLKTDRRAFAINITGEGKRTVIALVKPAEDVGNALLAPLPPEYRPLFIKCLGILAEAIDGGAK